MSLFLGKIHYWLFNKIRLTEELEQQLLQMAESKGIPTEAMKAAALKAFDAPLPEAPLEELINHQHIHGWLQHCITQAASRQAFYITQLLEQTPHLKEDLLHLGAAQAKRAAAQHSSVPVHPEAMFHAIHDYLLEGMPCDRTQQITENENTHFAWQYTPCLHRATWEAVKGDVNHFYDLRKSWIEAFIQQLQPSWRYTLSAEGTHRIQIEGGLPTP